MVYRPNIDSQLCFVLLPLRSPFIGYFEKIIKPAALEAGLIAVKADDIYGTRAVIRDIWEAIWKARAVVAIVTDKNPNVNYELGMCHSLGVPTVLITEREEDVPFDYRHRRYIRYEPREAGWEEKLLADLSKTLKAVLSSPAMDDELTWPYDTFELRTGKRIGPLRRSEDARESVVRGVELFTRWLAPAFGPHGEKVSVTVPHLGGHRAYRRGASIASGVKSGDPLEAEGIEQMRHLAQQVSNAVGDATKTAAFLCCSMVRSGEVALRAGHRSKYLVSGMQRAVETAVTFLMTAAKPVDTENLKAIALTASGGDQSVAAMTIDAFRRAGKDGVIEIVEGGGSELQLEVREGMQFDRGFLSPLFVNDSERQECVLENCYVLIYEKQIGSMREMLPLLEQVAKSGKPLLVISTDLVQEALATLIVNKQRGTLPCVAVKAPGAGDRRGALLDDIAVLTGAKAFLEPMMRPLDEVLLADLGRAQKVIVTKDSTTVIGGAGSHEGIQSRIKELRKQIDSTRAEYDQEKLRERLAKLGGAIAVLKAPGRTDDDLADSRYRIESAVHSCHSAMDNGWVPGGGVTYCRAKRLIEKLVPQNDTEKLGINAISTALAAPMLRLIENSGSPDPNRVLTEVLAGDDDTTGFNAETGKVANLLSIGVLDSSKALKEALLLAFAHAEGILKTGAWDTTSVIKQEETPGIRFDLEARPPSDQR